MPFHILANRTRGVSFAVMMLVPAAMFAMFYFLSVLVQERHGLQRAQDGLRLPAVQRRHRGLGRHRVQPDGSRSTRATSRASARCSPASGCGASRRSPYSGRHRQPRRARRRTSTDLLPWILVFSFGMGFGLRAADADGRARRRTRMTQGIGSGVLNAMQQVGGALGLATLSTVAVNAATTKGNEIFGAFAAAGDTESIRVTPAVRGATADGYLQRRVCSRGDESLPGGSRDDPDRVRHHLAVHECQARGDQRRPAARRRCHRVTSRRARAALRRSATSDDGRLSTAEGRPLA